MVYNSEVIDASHVVYPIHSPEMCELNSETITQVWAEHAAEWSAFANPDELPSRDELVDAFKAAQRSDALRIFGEGIQSYEILTAEYVRALGNYLAMVSMAAGLDRPVRIHEVGAGSARLSRALSNHFGELGVDVDLSASDSGTYQIAPLFPTMKLNFGEAINVVKPDIVLSSWMPRGKDWTWFFREAGVPAYILIGDADNGVCGNIEETWGRQARGVTTQPLPNPEYKKDGYVRSSLYDLTGWPNRQLNRYDKINRYRQSFSSDTFVFQKISN